MNRIVVFASGSGTNFQAIVQAVEKGKIEADITGLISSKNDIGAIGVARAAGIPWRVINPADYPDPGEFTEEILGRLENWKPDLIVLAGYLFKIPDAVIRAYPEKIINIHPSLLPRHGGKSYYGLRVHQAVLDAGEPESGCTVHLVNEDYDRGPVLAQRKVTVRPDDTPVSLAERILREEHLLLPEVIRQLVNHKKK